MENTIEVTEDFNPDKDTPVENKKNLLLSAAASATALMLGFTFVSGRISGFKTEMRLLKGFGVPALKMTAAYLGAVAAGNLISKNLNISKGSGLLIAAVSLDILLIINGRRFQKSNLYLAGVSAPVLVNFVLSKFGDKI